MRTAMLQARVTPEVKQAGEFVLRRIGLNLTEAMELFLRRVIVDQKLPFEVVALDDAVLAAVTKASDAHLRGEQAAILLGKKSKQPKSRQKRE